MSPRISAKREIEIKLRVSDLAGMLRRLRKLGAVSLGRVFEDNIVFDSAGSGFRRSGRLLRFRKLTPAPCHGLRGGPSSTILTSKAPPASVRRKPVAAGKRLYKEVQENEEQIEDGDRLLASFKTLGFKPGFRYQKYRTSFRHQSLHLDLDETPIGVFLELEGSPRDIDAVARTLGFASQDYIRATYFNLYVADCHRRHRQPRNMLFISKKSR